MIETIKCGQMVRNFLTKQLCKKKISWFNHVWFKHEEEGFNWSLENLVAFDTADKKSKEYGMDI